MSKFLLSLGLSLLVFSVHAQIIFKGQVLDDTEEALIGANVVEVNTQNGTSTDIQGYFELEVDRLPTVIEFSYVGFTTQEIQYRTVPSDPLEIIMDEGEIIVCGGCVVRFRGVRIGPAYDFQNNNQGVQAMLEVPYLWGMNLSTNIGGAYVASSAQKNLNLFIENRSLPYFGSICPSLAASYTYMDHGDLITKQLALGPKFMYRGFILGMSYVRQRQYDPTFIEGPKGLPIDPLGSEVEDGLQVSLSKYLLGFRLSSMMVHLPSGNQYNISAIKQINYRLRLNAGWQKMPGFQALTMSGMYTIGL